MACSHKLATLIQWHSSTRSLWVLLLHLIECVSIPTISLFMQLLCAPFTFPALPSLHKIHQPQQQFSHTVISRHHHQCVGSIEGFILLLLLLLVGPQYLSAKDFCQDIILTHSEQYLHSFFPVLIKPVHFFTTLSLQGGTRLCQEIQSSNVL